MIIQNGKLKFTEEDFLKLLGAIMIIQGRLPILYDKKIRRKLHYYYSLEEFNLLFKDIKDNFSFDSSYKIGIASGLFYPIRDEEQTGIYINISYIEAYNIINSYDSSYVIKMDLLAKRIFDKKKSLVLQKRK